MDKPIKKFKRIILISLDCLINNFDPEFDDNNFLPELNNRTEESIVKLSKYYDIKIYTNKNKILVSKWIISNGIENFIKDITNIKELCFLYIGKRCIRFQGNYYRLNNQINKFY